MIKYKINCIIAVDQRIAQYNTIFTQYLKIQNSPQMVAMIKQADAVCKKLLGKENRHSFGTSYDHCMRVASSLIAEFKITDPYIITSAILHDVLEDSNFDHEKLKQMFGNRVFHTLKDLNRKDIRWEKLKKAFPEKNLYRAIQNSQIMKRKNPSSLIKCIDKIDNIRDMLSIPKNDEKYRRIPYWIVEIKLSILPFAMMHYPIIASVMNKEMASIEAVFFNKVQRLFNDYSIRLQEALYIWEKI